MITIKNDLNLNLSTNMYKDNWKSSNMGLYLDIEDYTWNRTRFTFTREYYISLLNTSNKGGFNEN